MLVLDAMSGTGVRSLRYVHEVSSSVVHVHSNELCQGEHPLADNVASICDDGRCTLTQEDAVALYFRSKLSGDRYDMVDADAFGTGQPQYRLPSLN